MQDKALIKTNHPNNADKWRYTLMTTLLFLILVNPYFYKILDATLGKMVNITTSAGCPTMITVFIQAILFTIILRLLMEGN